MRKRRFYPRRSKDNFKQTPKIKPGADAQLHKVFSAIGVPEKKAFKPDPFQLKALDAIAGADCLVIAPTGAGKTWIAEQAIDRIQKAGKKSWYASPLKALSNSKYSEFSKTFGPENVGILTGDRKENSEASIIVGTTEILRNQLYDAMHKGVSVDTEFVVLDEAHFLGDKDRGVVWEEIMIYLPPRIPLLMLSATIGNGDQITGWLSSIRSRKCLIVEERKRPVPLFPIFFHPSGTLLPLLSQGNTTGNTKLSKKVGTYLNRRYRPHLSSPRKLPPFGEIIRVLRKFHLLPAIFFLKSRADCDQALELCRENLLRDPDRKSVLCRRIETLVSQSPHIIRHRQRRQLENLSVGAHHSGQLPSWKLLLETLMTEGLLDAVFATSTVAAGVNFPARSMVFLNSDRFNGTEFMPLTSTEFHQMTGRAGRRGMDRIGFAVTIPGKFMDIRFIARLIGSPPSFVLSQIKINFSMVLNLLLSHTPSQIEDLLKKSFAAYLISNKEKTVRQRTVDGSYLWQDFLRHLRFLEEKGFATETGDLTDDGKWASRLRIDQPLMVAESFRLGILPESDPSLLAAIIATFVNERESDDRIHKKYIPKKLLTAFLTLKRRLRPFAKHMAARGFDVRPFFLRPTAAIYAWATGHPWETVLSISEIEEGDLAMLILRTADNLRHIKALSYAFPEASETSAKAIEIILRDPVIMEYDS